MEQPLNRRRFCLIAIALAGLLGCAKTDERPTLSIAINAGVEGDGLKAAAKRFEALRGVKLQISELPYNSLYSKIMLSISGSESAFDVVMLDDPWFPKFAESAALEPLAPHYARLKLGGPDADFVPTSLALGRHPYGKGELYALPFVGNCQMFFYRKDALAALGLKVPVRSWTQVLEYAQKLMSADKVPFGYVIRGEKGNPIVVESMPIFWAFGAKMFRDGKVTVNSPEALKALKFLIGLKSVSPPGVENFNADQVANHMLQGNTAMTISWPAWVSTMEDPAQSRVVGKMGYSLMPGASLPGASVIGNWLLAIPKNSAQKELAFEFVRWITEAEQQRLNALETGNPPTRYSVFRDPGLLAKYPHYPIQLDALLHSEPRPRSPDWMEIENSYGIYLSQALSGMLTPEKALAKAQQAVVRIVGQ